MKFFVPDWDDRVDPGYDFSTDRFSLKRDPYRDDQYAHETMAERVYDGILVSRMALGETGPKRRIVEQIGMRAYLRLPTNLQLIGDCGAFGYIRDRHPRYKSSELVDYYGRLGFDLGVSVDHAIVPEFGDQRFYRYDLTIRNAEEFLRHHRAGKYQFTPIGAVQGWDVPSYVQAAQASVAMGYDYIALGGLARNRTETIRSIVTAVVDSIPSQTRIHVFGVARIGLVKTFLELNVTSIDSSSPLRQAWLSATDNYYGVRRTYAALRIPIADQERAVRDSLVARSQSNLATLRTAEREALATVRAFGKHEGDAQSTLRALMNYDSLLGQRKDGQHSEKRRALYRQTLRDRPWEHCRCTVCGELGVEIIIFRGNNRNRRRGYHNLSHFSHRLNLIKADMKHQSH